MARNATCSIIGCSRGFTLILESPAATERTLIPHGKLYCPRREIPKQKLKPWVGIRGWQLRPNLARVAMGRDAGAVILASGASGHWRRNIRRDEEEEKEVCRRRALAMKSRSFDGSAWKHHLFISSRGETLFTQSWTPLNRDAKALVIILHGLNEHSGRYTRFARQLNSCGYKIYGMDWIGHGGSDGLHGYVPSLDQVVEGTKMFLQKVRSENPGVPCFLFGHSTGGAIILKAALDPNVKKMVRGIITTSPALRVWTSHPIFVVIAPFFSLVLPRYQFNGANKRGTAVSHDPEALIAKYSDPLVYTGPIRVRTGCEVLRICSFLQQNMKRVTVPFLVLHGTADTVTDPTASQDLYDQAASRHKAIKLYEGLFHDLLFEPERDEIVSDILDWMDNKLES
ncbi:hypothetical protein SUGI_0187790 [Cryptomeria japonica]|nr:hypothetical protein SUGI_0187790 [Cryptomeria japonica]